MKRPSQTRNCTVQIRNELKPRTFVNLLQCSPDSIFRDFAPGCTPQTVLIQLKKASEGMIVPKCEFENHEEQTFLRDDFLNFRQVSKIGTIYSVNLQTASDNFFSRSRKHSDRVSILY